MRPAVLTLDVRVAQSIHCEWDLAGVRVAAAQWQVFSLLSTITASICQEACLSGATHR